MILGGAPATQAEPVSKVVGRLLPGDRILDEDRGQGYSEVVRIDPVRYDDGTPAGVEVQWDDGQWMRYVPDHEFWTHRAER